MEIGLSQGYFGFIYFDPTFEELVEVANQSFDTLRMGIHQEQGKEYLVFGNGYGTTHSTVSAALGKLNPRLRPNKDGVAYQGINGGTIILYFDGNRILVNGCDWSLSEKLPARNAAKYMKQPAKQQFLDLIKLLEEKQSI